MEKLLPEFVTTHWYVAVAVLVISTISALLKIFINVFQTHEEWFVRRSFKRLLLLRKHVNADSPISGFLNKRIEEESFALASGIHTSAEKSKMLIKLYQLDFMTNAQLKRVVDNLQPAGDKIKFELNRFEKFEVIYSFWASLFLMGGSIMLGILILVSNLNLLGILASLATMVTAYLFVARFIGLDFQKYKTIYFCWQMLETQDLVANPDFDIKTRFVYTPNYLE